MKLSVIFIAAWFILISSCSKDNDGISGGGINVYYIIEGVYDPIPDQPEREGQVEVIASMTMPAGNASEGNVLTPYTSPAREYEQGMTITVYAESVLSYTTITVKIFRDNVLWKSNTASATGFGHYAIATISGTL